ncbi:4-hydroxy-tetrahydrodipicolinate synthase [Zobellia galactanivorans]|uniref:4-hydroxy-tetrahydrodipicolinate synthase n=1 Tax=Zobellia galactanivorans (strain DSM 12802 / CCUG 47099 / CIP 106680 / NCIMB 13871 / Dsij) TaxID=63186 RepID=G0L752_ZOBGA|nr:MULTISPECIES: 4-hydroxy-tetrahydrodipicolinate synthase [Zobellia]MBU3027086.1 4-hydroxy-tetrahydrodipicolinate synthase [Zobellia galactanivorans]MDO6807984.1 4-hydroxy-tetrahydrodipicolinate synthase [Zobellia galactanivorans]OWW24883.1 4-hydroxy-tetrahydrodipicolinate synthase [Zobellia sp. OII3]CAZ98904.1 Dihydrodipicolinate synthetase [Zobellia galactanivorans]
MKQLIGTGVALITPFKTDFSVDVDALHRIVNYCVDGGVDYLVVLGTTGESVTLTKEEKQLVIDTVTIANAGRLPLVVGVGGNNTVAVIEDLQKLDLTNFDAVLSVSPYYNRPTQEGIYQHFKAIAQVSPKPIILYNVPGRTGSNMLPETVARLADVENIVAIKEASGNMVQVQEMIQACPKDFHVISGDDFTALATVLAGGSGVISVLGQGLPREFSNMIRSGLNRNVDEAYRQHYELQEGMGLIFKEGNPAGIKAIFEVLGLSGASVRLPLIEASDSLKKNIANFVKPFKVFA